MVEVVERVVDAGEACGHAALDDHNGAGLVDGEDGHAVDRAAGVGACCGIGDIVGTDDESDVGLRHIAVDVVHFEQPVIGDIGFGEQHVHVAGHASGDWMNAEADIDAALAESVEEFANFVLGLRDGHAVAGNDDDFVGGGEDSGGFFRGGAFDGALLLRARSGGLNLSEAAEEHVGERAIHGFGHDDGKNEAGGAVERASDDQQLAIEHEAHGRGGKAGVRVQERDDSGHVRPTDGDDQHHAEDERDDDHGGEEFHLLGMHTQDDGDGDGESEHAEVDEVLSFIGDGSLRQNFLELPRGHQAAGEGERAENYFHGEDGHHERGNVGGAEIKLRGADQRDAEGAERVAERGPLRHGGHGHFAEGHADDAAEDQADGYELVVDNAAI